MKDWEREELDALRERVRKIDQQKELIKATLDNIRKCKDQNGSYTHDVLAYVPDVLTALLVQIAELNRLKSMSLEEFCLWQKNITPVNPEKDG